MIDPANITNFNRTKEELEEFLLFALCVAGKTASIQAKKLDQFLSLLRQFYMWNKESTDDVKLSPFELLSDSKEADVLTCMKEVGLGQYHKLLQGFEDVRHLDVFTCTLEDLEKCYGVGPKTSRFFLLHSRPDQMFSVIDTHILKELRSLGYKVPNYTPSGKTYDRLELIVLYLARQEGLSPADWDLKTWKKYTKNPTS